MRQHYWPGGSVHFRDEPFIVELTGRNNRSFVFANTDGLGGGQLGGDDTLSFCYSGRREWI
jgi:hypothetical protein